MNGWVAGWRLALRIAWRDAWKAKGRSALVVVMILLPVSGVATADVLIRTSQLSDAEAVPRYMGAATARVELMPRSWTQLTADPFRNPVYTALNNRVHRRPSLASLGLGDRPSTPIDTVYDSVDVSDGRADAAIDLVEPRNPLAAGLYHLRSGRWPSSSDEVVVDPWLAARGPSVGQTLRIHMGRRVLRRTVVGIADSERTARDDVVVALPGSVPDKDPLYYPGGRGYLLGGPPISWQQVTTLNARGALVFSRAVAADPPNLSPGPRFSSTELSIVALIVVMALLEVVLLAGPALAVGAKRQSRALALLATAGGTPSQMRRVVLATGVVLGAVGAAGGVLVSLPLARLLEPALQRLSVDRLGPYDVRWRELLVIAAFGLGSALLAALVPAWIASRQDVVAVLAGRRGDRRPGRRSPVAGVVLLGLGVAVAAAGAHLRSETGAVLIPLGTLLCVLGMILLVGVVVAGMARLSGRLPLALRFAVRDADRHRTRMVPAVAAVAATVVGLTAVGIGFASYEAKQRAEYVPDLPIGQGIVTDADAKVDWGADIAAIRAQAPAASVQRLGQVVANAKRGYVTLKARVGDRPVSGIDEMRTGGPSSAVLVSDSTAVLPPLMTRSQTAAAQRVLRDGGAVVWGRADLPLARGTLTLVDGDHSRVLRRMSAPVLVLHPDPRVVTWGMAVLSPRLAARTGLRITTSALIVEGIRTSSQPKLSDTLRGLPGSVAVEFENGFAPRTFIRLLELVLFALGAFLVVGGTLTATFLSLADARPDLATLAAVGAGGWTRRLVAAAYALVVSMVGAVLGVAVGLVPGIAIVYPINSTSDSFAGVTDPSLHITMPWLVLVVVLVGLPVAMALAAGALTRGRLPMVARLS